MIEQGITFYFTFVLFLLLLLVLSIIIPFYGYLRKRWKGLQQRPWNSTGWMCSASWTGLMRQ